ncbi:hypothetical protein GYMLUDRAFT_76564 [Collybiopsis luxurians FD-317 M1]|uniref:Uncharacterized protein n=1 Tax=Collybiopsis luxurians FD-317 M1 TaxID=944289 RepID=A0A0D0BZH3_9AGAR|nr:hypothetical protein GYMLUDRAFT_76564 [Collybiopsis luxurians FD-317 M1]
MAKTENFLFTKLLSMKDVPARVLAGYYYDQNFHDSFCDKRNFNCYRLSPRNLNSAGTTRSWCTVGSHPVIFTMRSYNIRIFNTKDKFKFEAGWYYKPRSKTFPTFDAIFAVTDKHVVTVQASVTDEHSFKESGMDWLASHGAETMEYIYLSPPQISSVTILFPASTPPTIIPVDTSLKRKKQDSSSPTVKEPAVKIVGIYHVHMLIE